MRNVTTFTVVPRVPAPLAKLTELVSNYWWCWEPDAIELFQRVDRDVWAASGQNPVRMLGEISQERLEELAQDESYLSQLERVALRQQEYLTSDGWMKHHPDVAADFNVVYLSAEFGIHESLSVYSGGLGVLAGDHLKSASDLGIPLAGMGLLYREGYHRQYLNADGWQQERYPHNDVYQLPLTLVRDAKGAELTVTISLPESDVSIRVWECRVGRVPLFLLDTDFEANGENEREITARLYGGDRDTRIRQEIVLGMGAVLMLKAMGRVPTVYHMNEGHSAFMALERIRQLMKNEQLEFDHALEAVKAASVFTTHTPVPAGNDTFDPTMIEHFFKGFTQDVGISMKQLLAMGRQDPSDKNEPFNMTVLALNASSFANGVAKLHGETARGMWARVWPGVPVDEVPITSITNGIHPRFWISREIAELFDLYLGPAWISNPSDPDVWKQIKGIPDAELWRMHERRRERLVGFARRHVASFLEKRGASSAELHAAAEILDPEVLTIGIARRFATYKRLTLILSDLDRTLKLLRHSTRPVQLVFSGKAHPQDTQGKEFIRDIVHFIRENHLQHRVVFLEDYDINVARHMVQGVDCWLNTPRRPLEASGTSGMKAAANGALNISIPDGWWAEAELLGEHGWSIGRGERYENTEEQDRVESGSLYEIIERDVTPLFYDRGSDGLPRGWIHRMKASIEHCLPVFNTHRMVAEYAERAYAPSMARRVALRENGRARSKALAAWKKAVRDAWPNVQVASVESGPTESLAYGTDLSVAATVQLGTLTEKDVCVEVYYGGVDTYRQLKTGTAVAMTCTGKLEDGLYRYEGALPCDKTGRLGFAVRVTPCHEDLANQHELGLIAWA